METISHAVGAEFPASPSSKPMQARSVESADLLQGDRELLIRHGASIYRLRVTTSEKLILTK